MAADLIITAELLQPLPNYETEKVAQFMEKVMPAMVALFRSKDINYGGSWQNKGILSAQLNFERKIDRVNAQFYNSTITSVTNENIGDTMVDTGVYPVMYLYYLYNKLPHVKQWVDNFINQYNPANAR